MILRDTERCLKGAGAASPVWTSREDGRTCFLSRDDVFGIILFYARPTRDHVFFYDQRESQKEKETSQRILQTLLPPMFLGRPQT